MNMRKNILIITLSFLYSAFLVIGNSFLISNSFHYIEKHLLLNISLFILLVIIFYFLVKYLFEEMSYHSKKKSPQFSNNKIFKLFDKYPFMFSIIFILCSWLPYIIAFYPIVLNPDASAQIKQYFHIKTEYSYYSIMLDPRVTITAHHPVIHTLLLGSSLKLGLLLFKNTNAGLFIYSILQISILSSTLAYTIKFLKNSGVSNKYLFLILLIYSFVPVFPFFAMTGVKDVIFTSLVILYIMTLYKLIKLNNLEIYDIMKIIILLTLLFLFRNNGIHVLILSFPFLFFLKKKKLYKGKLAIIFLSVIVLFLSYNKLILPYFRITPTSVREMLSIPFQQTARLVSLKEEVISNSDKKIIDKVLEYDTLKERYKPEISDPVKNKYNKYATKKDLNNYYKVWLKYLFKEPKIYLESFISNTSGYYFPFKTKWYFYYKLDKGLGESNSDYHYNSLKILRKILSSYGKVFPKILIIGLLVNIGFNFYLLLLLLFYFIYIKKFNVLIYLLPSFVLFLVCLASPVNAYFRYAMPYVFALPLNCGIFLKERK